MNCGLAYYIPGSLSIDFIKNSCKYILMYIGVPVKIFLDS